MTRLYTAVEPAPSRFQILAIDGGGVKGVFSAAVLAGLERDVGSPVLSMFDLVVGTSTGGIIALALGAGLRPAETVEVYRELGGAPFRGRWWRQHLGWAKSAYPAGRLRSLLVKTFGQRTLGDSRCRLVIPSYNLTDDCVRLFKTPHHPALKRDHRIRMVDVAMATSAAPTYFPAAVTEEGVRLVDGGLWANNPALVGVAEAVSLFNAPLDAIRVLSIGTTTDLKHRHERLDAGGRIRWAGDAVDLVMRAQSLAATSTLAHLLGDRVLRVDPDVPAGRLRLDHAEVAELTGRADNASLKHLRRFEELFADHLPPPFVAGPHHNED